jgi:hypothetical protein
VKDAKGNEIIAKINQYKADLKAAGTDKKYASCLR